MQNNEEQTNLLREIFDIVYDGLEVLFRKIFNIQDYEEESLSVEIERLFPTLKENIPYKLPTKEDISEFRIPIGESFHNEIKYIYPNKIPHSLISGTTGSGKSVCTKSILTSILNMYDENECEVILIDFKIVELNLFKKCKQITKYVYETEEAVEVIADLLEECRRRYKLFQDADVTNLEEYNKKFPNKKLKKQFIFIEEFIMFAEEKTGIKMLRKLASLSRASSQFIFLSCQRPDHTIIDNVLKCNVGNRICFRTEDAKNSAIVIDREGAEKLRGNGHGIYKSGGEDAEIQGYFISNDKIKEYTKGFIKDDDCNSTKDKPQTTANNKIIDLKFLDNL